VLTSLQGGVAQKIRAVGRCALKRCHYISQGSVATRLRCGGIFIDDFVRNLRYWPTIPKVGVRDRVRVSM